MVANLAAVVSEKLRAWNLLSGKVHAVDVKKKLARSHPTGTATVELSALGERAAVRLPTAQPWRPHCFGGSNVLVLHLAGLARRAALCPGRGALMPRAQLMTLSTGFAAK